MPVGTHATVKAVGPDDLEAMGASIVLSNTYHLLLRPGPELIERFGGLHGFMRWPHSILTDSGGFQVFSLGNLREVDDEGVRFRSHLDGAEIVMTPESVMRSRRSSAPTSSCRWTSARRIPARQRRRGSPLSARTAGPSARSPRSPARSGALRHPARLDGSRRCAPPALASLASLPFDGFSIGGLSVGEPKDLMWRMLEAAVPELPDAKPRHLLGVGSPDDLLEGVARGVDLFDCVLPTRTARTGGLYTPQGRVNVRTARFREEQGPVDPDCDCYTCRTFSAGYLHHLIRAEGDDSKGELLYYRLASIHNLRFLIRLMEGARAAILAGTFPAYRERFLAGFTPPDRAVAEEQRRKRAGATSAGE